MRNMIDVNKNAFDKLIEQFLSQNNEFIETAKRYITTNDEEKNWIKISSFSDKIWITPSIRVVELQFQDIIYFAVIGASLCTTDLDELVIKEIEPNAGVVSLLISEGLLRLDKKSNNLQFYDSILFQHKDKDYKGHNHEDLLEFLEVFHFFVVPKNSLVKSNWASRISCYIFSKNPSLLILDFDKNVANLISDLSISGSDYISYNILLSCLFSTSYKHAFLELYRLIERLFPIPYLKEFHNITNSKLDFLDFVAKLENITKWRPREDEAIEKIFQNSKQTTRSNFQAFSNSSTNFQNHSDFTFFYSIRNSIVHFRANHTELDLTNNQWQLLLYATVSLIDEQYSTNNDVLK